MPAISTPVQSRRAALLFTCAAAVPISCLADDASVLRAVVDKAIVPLMAQHQVPGMAVAVTVNGQVSFFNYGLASKAAKIPVREQTLFELGSVSKTLTATLTGYAIANGKLALDDNPGKYLPALRGTPIGKATLLHLGTYTAGGLPLQFPDEVTNDTMLPYFQQWKSEAQPGTQRTYSNPSIGLLGHIAAQALNRPFADVMEQNLLPKLGLFHTNFRIPEHERANYAWGYKRNDEPVHVNPGVFADEAYGIKSSASDVIRFVQVNINPGALEPTLARGVAATQVGYFQTGAMVQGLGWEQYPYPTALDSLLSGNSQDIIQKPNASKLLGGQPSDAPTLFNKTGSTGGFGSYVAFVPAKRIGVVMLANKNYPIPARVTAAHAILTQLAAQAK